MTRESNTLIEERLGHVLVLTMNRPARHHALNHDLAGRLAEAVDRAESESEVRVIILTGSGSKAFCAGQDMLEASGVEAGAADLAAQALQAVPVAELPTAPTTRNLKRGRRQ